MNNLDIGDVVQHKDTKRIGIVTEKESKRDAGCCSVFVFDNSESERRDLGLGLTVHVDWTISRVDCLMKAENNEV